MSFRVLLQPTMATIFAIRDGLKDARQVNHPLLFSLTNPNQRAHYCVTVGTRWLRLSWPSFLTLFTS